MKIAALITALVVFSSTAFACVDVDIGPMKFDLCPDGGQVSLRGPLDARIYKYSNPPAWRIELKGIPNVAHANLEINSGGPYKDRLILEMCVMDPTFVKVGGGSLLTVGKDRCGKWIDLGPFGYPG